jgi:hypothetical protein
MNRFLKGCKSEEGEKPVFFQVFPPFSDLRMVDWHEDPGLV